MSYTNQIRRVPVTILAAASQATVVPIDGLVLVGIEMPAAWTAAAITFDIARDGSSALFQPLTDTANTEFTIPTPTAAKYIAMNPMTQPLYGWGQVRLRSGTFAAPVAQAAQRDFFLIFRELT